MEGEKYEESDRVDSPRIERRTSPTDSIFGNPNDDPYNSDMMVNQETTLGREVSDEKKFHSSVPLATGVTSSSSVIYRGKTKTGADVDTKWSRKNSPLEIIALAQSVRTRGEDEALELQPAHTKSSAYVGDYKRGHVPSSVKLKDFGEESDASDDPLINQAKAQADSNKISEKNQRWQHPKNESDSIVIRPNQTAGRSNMVGVPASVLEPSILSVKPKETKNSPMFDAGALEQRSNKAFQAFSLLGLVHVICALLFAANTYYVPIYDLKDNDTGDVVGKITFQKVEIFCDECDGSTTLTSESYLNVCGIDEANESFTDGFISDYTTAALLSFIAFLMAAGNVVIILVLFCFLLAKKITNLISQVLIVIGGLVSLGELLVGLIIPLHTQLGTWNRDKVNDIFAVSEFECEETIYVFSSFGFLLVWIVLGCVLIDLVITQRLFTLVRTL